MFATPGSTRSRLDTRSMPLRLRRLALLPALALLLVTAPGVAAGQPTAMDLNPPPPDFYTCTPLGNGAICHAVITNTYGPDPTGIICQGAAGPFEVFDQARHVVDATRWYDRDGNLVKRIRAHTFLDARLSDPLSGRSVGYSQRDRDEEVFAIPGDLDSATLYSENKLVAVVPGSGAVLVENGRFVATGDEVLQLTGRRDLSDFFAGDTAALDGLCSALDG